MYKSTFFILLITFIVFALIFASEESEYEIVYYDESFEETILYLLNRENQLVLVEYDCKNDIQEIFDLYTINANKLPIGVRTALPYRLTLNEFRIEDKILYLSLDDFDYPNLSQVIEALTWTFTENDGIEKVFIEANDYSSLVTKDNGINKTIETSSFDNKIITIYYLEDYIHPVSYIVNDSVDEFEYIAKKTTNGDISRIVKEESLNIYFNKVEVSASNFDNLSYTINKLGMYKSVNVYLNKELIYSRFL